MSLPIYNSAQMQKWDRFTIENEPIASIDLMERAASLATKAILGRNAFSSVAIFCGPGNNGGDGLVIARLLAEVKKDVTVYCLKFAQPTEDFSTNYKRLPKSVKVVELTENSYEVKVSAGLIVDAIFGSGLNRDVTGWIADVILEMNNLKGVKVAIDIPSGLFAVDNLKNESFPAVFEADETLTFMTPKMAFFYPTFAGFVGNFRVIDIGLHKDFQGNALATFLGTEDIAIKARKTFSHKGLNGALTLIAGLGNMTGAAVIASKAAAKSGSGYVFAVSSETAKTSIIISTPEVIWQNANDFTYNDKTTAIAIGPGLGEGEIAKKLLKLSLSAEKPIVLDADALNIIAKDKNLQKEIPTNAILTPHIGELKRLVGIHRSDEELLQAQIDYSVKHQVYIIQKGPFSKLTTPEGKVIINSTGNPGMASAGIGDALTGIIGSFLAQGYHPEDAAKFAMYLHGYAADQCAKDQGEIGLLASDVVDRIPGVLNQFVKIEA